MDAEDQWEPPVIPWPEDVWRELFETGGAVCTFCDSIVNDRRYAVALQFLRAWEPETIEVRLAHVECLRRSMHPKHKLH
jgi:hypothetical protein